MPVTIFLLRAVNLGGASTIKMAALRALCPPLGLRHAATLLQSGNLVACHDGEARDIVARKLEEAIAATHPMRPRVIARSQAELQDILTHSPLPAAERQPNWLLVMPLDAVPTDGAIDRLRAWHKGPEEIGLRGRDLYLHYSEGIGRSKLTNAVIERHLGVQGTARNWTTLTKLAALAQEVAGHG
ncbi:DUF1697 domain-containing protein [Bosea sp. LjRoot9]|uniref:DUF1697 domain-containing protein n=1 Tax=Bosea sp. LjRoot9 TaxID=3342341 RepID=UPI003ECFE5B0